MDITCVACAKPMTITDSQVGGAVRCPTCRSKLLLRRFDQMLTEPVVTCPGCAVKLALPRANAEVFRCPKCSQQLREPGSHSLVDVWRQQDLAAADPTPPPIVAQRPAALVRTSRSSRKASPNYSDDVQSVGPGGLLCAQALIALFINGFQFLATEEITQDVADADALKTKYITTAIIGAVYQFPILIGSIQMIMRQYIWAGRIACILALFPATLSLTGLLVLLRIRFYPWRGGGSYFRPGRSQVNL